MFAKSDLAFSCRTARFIVQFGIGEGGRTHHEDFLHFGDPFAENGPELIPNSSQQEAKQGDPKQGIDDAECPPTFGVGGDVPKT